VNRFGKIILGLLVLAGIGFAAMLRFGHPVATPPAPPAGPPSPSARGALVMPSGLALPVAGVQPSALYDSFGDPRGGGARGHGALDIMAPTGTPVLAAAAGTVEKLFESKDGGHTIYIRSPDGRFVYYYAHLDSYLPETREGANIARGQQIATVGSTGDADPAGPHLHFEIKRMAPGQKWYEGEGINPYPLLAGNAASR
jgi:murein DD-endopeptidase MepM/ murein hydrolase activator NlpD